jgi:linoleoyl-CoA desaturase
LRGIVNHLTQALEKFTKPQFPKAGNEGVFRQLRKDVSDYVQQATPAHRPLILFKAFLFPVLYGLTYFCALYWGADPAVLYGCYFLLGLLLVTLFLNNIHDAVHATIFKSKKWNDAYVYLFDLMGANSFMWKLRHIRFHHNYPNVAGWDTDIEQSTLARVFPDGPYLKMHRLQHIYLPLLYPFYLPNWLLVRDFKDFFDRRRTVRKLVEVPPVEYIKLFVFKAAFLFLMIGLPKLVLGVGWTEVLGAFLLLLFSASIFSLLVLLSPHANIHAEFPLEKDNELPYDWMTHMLKTTNDITSDNWFTRFFMGCFNYHVAHHLFPNVNHVYYPQITHLLKDYAHRYHLPYREYPLWRSLKNHYRLLKQNRQPENFFEETM